jgi:hypothetical protein
VGIEEVTAVALQSITIWIAMIVLLGLMLKERQYPTDHEFKRRTFQSKDAACVPERAPALKPAALGCPRIGQALR